MFFTLTGHWYSNQGNVGAGNISRWLKEICALAGISPRSNHKLRHYAPTRMAESGIERHIIVKQTRHKSEASVNSYFDNSIALKTKIAASIAGVKRDSPNTPTEESPRKCHVQYQQTLLVPSVLILVIIVISPLILPLNKTSSGGVMVMLLILHLRDPGSIPAWTFFSSKTSQKH